MAKGINNDQENYTKTLTNEQRETQKTVCELQCSSGAIMFCIVTPVVCQLNDRNIMIYGNCGGKQYA